MLRKIYTIRSRKNVTLRALSKACSRGRRSHEADALGALCLPLADDAPQRPGVYDQRDDGVHGCPGTR